MATTARRSNNNWVWVTIAVVTLFVFALLGLIALSSVAGGTSATGSQVGLIELSGMITDEGTGMFSKSGGARKFMEYTAAAERDDSVKAVLIRINSPGGSASASQEMFQAVTRLKKKKPVICSMGDVAASGGFYVAAACDRVYANGSTLTGSIGVISQFMSMEGLYRKIGVNPDVVKSGKFKDAGNPARPLTAEERKLFQTLIMDVYDQFVTDVVAGRKTPTNGKLTRARLLKLADGRVYTGRQAKNSLLIDEIGGLHEALREAAKRGGITADPPRTKKYGSGALFDALLGADAKSTAADGLEAMGQAAGRGFVEGAKDRLGAETGSSATPQLR